ncbi:MAG: type I secretion system permease/ATPase [Pseudomonadota bacterium]
MNQVQRSELSEAMAKCRGVFVSVGFFSFFINVLMLTGPLFMLQVYDRVLASRSEPTLWALLTLVAGLFVFMGLLDFVRSRLLMRAGWQLDQQLSDRVFNNVLTHARFRTPGVGSQPVRDLETLRQFLSGQGLLGFFDLPWMPLYIAVLFILHWSMALFAVIAAIVLLTIAVINEVTTRRSQIEAKVKSIETNQMMEEFRRNADVVRAMGMDRSLLQRWHAHHDTGLDAFGRSNDLSSTFTTTSKHLRLFLQSAMLALGAYLAIYQIISPGTMIAGSILMARALAPLDQLIGHWRAFLGARKAHERINMALKSAPVPDQPMPLPAPKGRLTVENLTVMAPGGATNPSAAGNQKPIIQGINFDLKPGSALGIIGPSGAGKSTLARVLAGIWPAARGSVRVDGAAIEQWDPHHLGKYLGYMPQEVELFGGTVRDNICRFEPDADPKNIVNAAKVADVHDMILRLPDGYDTKIGEGGAALSSGQRQRIGLARALYGWPRVIIMDEPNSNLDAVGEAALVQAIHSARANNATVVVIAHRPSAIGAVEELLFMQDGRQMAYGPRDEVLKQVLRSDNNAPGIAGPGSKPKAVPGQKQTRKIAPTSKAG